MSEGDMRLLVAVLILFGGVFVLGFVLCAAILPANQDDEYCEGSLSQGSEAGSEATEPLDRERPS